jgi:hypothetical protein
MRYYFAPTRMTIGKIVTSADKHMEKLELAFIADGN